MSDTDMLEQKNEHIAVKVKKEPGCKVTFDITITSPSVKDTWSKAVKKVNKSVSVPGFRKGKAPDPVIVQHYKKYVDQEWRDLLIGSSFSEAVDLTKIYPFDQKNIRPPTLKATEPDQEATVTISFESAPDIPSVDPSALTVKKIEPKAVEEQDVEDTLENIQLHHATWDEVTDRPVREGDFAEIDIENLDKPGQFICRDTRFNVKKGKMGDWMHQLILGCSPGGSVEGVSEKSADADPDAPFTPTKCKITVKKILTPNLPPLDDDLAKKAGVDNVEILKERVEADLVKQEAEAAEEKMREELEKEVLKLYPFEVPATLVEQEKNARIRHAEKVMEEEKEPPEAIAERLNELNETLGEELNRAYQTYFLMRKVAEEAGLTPSKDELLKEMMKLMYSGQLSSQENIEQARNQIQSALLLKMAKDYLIGKANVAA